jgi:hypothetical protein
MMAFFLSFIKMLTILILVHVILTLFESIRNRSSYLLLFRSKYYVAYILISVIYALFTWLI